MSETISFDFGAYVQKRKEGDGGGTGEDRYAYQGDLDAQEKIKKLAPVVAAIETTVRLFKNLWKNELLGHAVLVTPKQFPSVHELMAEAARRLAIAVPTVYVTQHPSLNAGTFGTETDSFIIVNSATVDHLSKEELLFVIGHECGHIQNGHVTLRTAAYFLKVMGGAFLRWLSTPAQLALDSWSRQAEITCDRAGLLCARDLEVGQRSLVKLALGSKKLYDQIDIDEYLKQLDQGRQGAGKYAELFSTHPYLPKRVAALLAFAESRVYRKRALGQEGGLDIHAVDQRVAQIIKIV